VGSPTLFALLFWSNFNFENPVHIGIFAVTSLVPVGEMVSGIFLQSWPGRQSAGWMVASHSGVGLAWYWWTIPEAKGLPH